MVKRNNLRKIYMIYTITISELFALAIIFCAGNLFNGLPLEIIWILGIIAVICIPVVMYLFYRWRRKDNAASSDELEQLVLTKAFAAAGFAAVSLLPLLFLLATLLSSSIGYIIFGYAAIIGGILKCSTYYYYKKY